VTLIVRRLDAPVPLALGAAGACRVSLCVVVGLWGRGPKVVKVIILGGN
jgi:hypothetical protein